MVLAEEVYNKKVLDCEGNLIGFVKKIDINPDSLSIEGFYIGNGGLFPDNVYIARPDIKKINDKEVIMDLPILRNLIGIKVLDSKALEIGVIKKAEFSKDKKQLKKIIITISLDNILKEINLPVEEISTIGEEILIKKTKEELI